MRCTCRSIREARLVCVPGRGRDRAQILGQDLAAVDVVHDVGEELALDVKLAEAMAGMRKASIEKLTEDRQKHERGGEDYRRLDQLVSQETAELQIQVELWKKQFVRQEANLYHEAYRQVQKVVDAYMEEQGERRLREIEAGRDVIVNSGYSPDIETAILVSLQTDYAGWRGANQIAAMSAAASAREG